MTHDKSLREIEKETGLNYAFVRRILLKTKKEWEEKNAL